MIIIEDVWVGDGERMIPVANKNKYYLAVLMCMFCVLCCHGVEYGSTLEPVIFTTESVNGAIAKAAESKSYFSYGTPLTIQVLIDRRIIIQSGFREKAFLLDLDGTISVLAKPGAGVVFFSQLLFPVVTHENGKVIVEGNEIPESVGRHVTCFDANDKYFALQMQGGRGSNKESKYWIMSVDHYAPVLSGTGWVYFVQSEGAKIELVISHYSEREYIVSTFEVDDVTIVRKSDIAVRWPESVRSGSHFVFKDYDINAGKMLFAEGRFPRSILRPEIIWEYDISSRVFKKHKLPRFGMGRGRGNLYALFAHANAAWAGILKE